MNKLIAFSIVIVVAGSFIFFQFAKKNSKTGQIKNSEKKEVFEKTPNFNLKDYNGRTITFFDLSGKPLIINSWATWCPFCNKELKDFAAVQKEFGDKIVIIAINRSESLGAAKKFSDEFGLTDDLMFFLDPNDSFYRSMGGFSMPETIFVDRNGFIQFHKRGPMEIEEIRQRINNLLEING